jgi:hypothetical protein
MKIPVSSNRSWCRPWRTAIKRDPRYAISLRLWLWGTYKEMIVHIREANDCCAHDGSSPICISCVLRFSMEP